MRRSLTPSRVLLGFATAMALVVAACGSDDDGGSDEPTESVVPEATDAPDVTEAPDDTDAGAEPTGDDR